MLSLLLYKKSLTKVLFIEDLSLFIITKSTDIEVIYVSTIPFEFFEAS